MAGLGSFLGNIQNKLQSLLGKSASKEEAKNPNQAPPPDPPPRSGRDDAIPLSGAPPSNSKSIWTDELSSFLHGTDSPVSSSNVASGKYNPIEHYMELSFNNGGRYGYHDISPQEATNFYSAKSKGGWVWDNLRRRGTKWGYQKPYAYIAGQSNGYEPSYYGNDDDRELHRRINPAGNDLEWSDTTDRKIPKAYHAQHKANGGFINGDPAVGDNVDVKATAGEFIVNKEAAAKHKPELEQINNDKSPDGKHFAVGGPIPGSVPGYNGGATVTSGWNPAPPNPSAAHAFVPPTPVEPIVDVHVVNYADFDFGGRGGGSGSGREHDPGSTWGRMVGGFFGSKIGGFLGGESGRFVGGLAGEHVGAHNALAGGPVGIAAMAASKGLDALSEKLSDLTAKALDPKTFIGGLLAPVSGQVGAFNPAVMDRFNLALDNLSAAVGVVFVPFVEAGRGFADEMNVLYTSIAPHLKSALEPIIPLFTGFGREFAVGFIGMLKDGATELKPVFTELKPVVIEAGIAFKEIFAQVVPLGKAVFDLFGGMSTLKLWVEGTVFVLQSFTSAIQETSNDIRNAIAWIKDPSKWLTSNVDWGKTLSGVLGGPLSLFLGNTLTSNRPPSRPTAPLTGGMSAAAQPARHVGIEQVGMEARLASMSQGASIQEQQLTELRALNASIRQMLILQGRTAREIAEIVPNF